MTFEDRKKEEAIRERQLKWRRVMEEKLAALDVAIEKHKAQQWDN